MWRVGNGPRGGYGHRVVMYRAGRVRERKADLHGAKLAVIIGG